MLGFLVLFFFACASTATIPFSTKDPFSDLKVPSFQRMAGDSGVPTSFWSRTLLDGRSLPTNAWWMNFVLPNGEDDNNNVFVFPHIHIARKYGLTVVNPFVATSGTQAQSNFDPIVEPIVLGSPDITNQPHVVSDFDVLSTTLSWGNMYAPIIRGMAFSTMIYNGAVSASVSSSQIAKSVKVDGVLQDCSSNGNNSFTASEVEVSFIQSDATYLVFFDGPTALSCSASASSFVVSTASAYDGAVRVALSNNCTYGFNTHHCPQENLSAQTGVDQSAYSALLRGNFATYPVGGLIDYSVDETLNLATINFEYKTATMDKATPQDDKGELLMFTLPHHRDSFASASIIPVGHHRTLRGVAKPLLGSKWTLLEKLTPLQFEASNPVPADKKAAIIEALQGEADYDLPLNYQVGAGDTYFSGKMIAKLARLAEIAAEVEQPQLLAPLLARLKERLDVWVNGSSAALMLYDASWGGYVSCGCLYEDCWGSCTPTCNNVRTGAACPAIQDAGMNFGNGKLSGPALIDCHRSNK